MGLVFNLALISFSGLMSGFQFVIISRNELLFGLTMLFFETLYNWNVSSLISSMNY